MHVSKLWKETGVQFTRHWNNLSKTNYTHPFAQQPGFAQKKCIISLYWTVLTICIPSFSFYNYVQKTACFRFFNSALRFLIKWDRVPQTKETDKAVTRMHTPSSLLYNHSKHINLTHLGQKFRSIIRIEYCITITHALLLLNTKSHSFSYWNCKKKKNWQKFSHVLKLTYC